MATKTTENFINGAIDKTGDCLDRDILSDVGWSIAEEYVNARLDIHLHVRFATEEYCANLNRNVEVNSSGGSAPEGARHKRYLTEVTPCEQQVSVLVRIVQDLKIPEIPPVVPWRRTIARLQRIDDGAYCVRYASQFSCFFSLVSGGVLEDGELVSVIGDIPFGQNQLPDQVVERTSEVVEHLSEEHFQTDRHGRHIVEAADLLSRLVIDIAGNDIGFEILEGQEVLAQRLDMLTGPVILDERTVERSHAETLHKDDSEDPTGSRDSGSDPGGLPSQSRKGSRARAERLVVRP